MKKLVIAEKPSVATDIAKVLGKMKKVDDHYENENFIVSSAVGHLIELPMPADIDKKFARWSLSSLPILPEKFNLKPIEKTKKKFQSLKKLMSRDDISEVINACDAGREGELIFTYIYELAKCKINRTRLWMSSMTPDSIKNAFQNLRTQDEMSSLQDAARCRSESDWLIGINGTRAITIRMFGGRNNSLVSVGRVQTPTLAMIVDRENEIQNFKPKSYWKIFGTFEVKSGIYEGVYQKPNFKNEDKDSQEKIDRVWSHEEAERILLEIRKIGIANVIDKKTLSKQSAPRLYDLTTLQREANTRFSLPAAKTLSIAQALYEKHKMITYPRTDSRALPEDYRGVCDQTMRGMSGIYKPFANKAIEEKFISKAGKRIFNNAQVSDHFAIIPTGETDKKLSDDEQKIYDMIARRFIAAFYPEAQFDVTVRTSTLGDHIFKTEGKVLRVAGWKEVYDKVESDDESAPNIPPLVADKENANLKDSSLKEEMTKPPARYTEATLLSAMEGAGKLIEDEELAEAMKEKGLGTPATRAQIIDTLIHHKLLERNGRDLFPTTKAESLITFLKVVGVEELTSPTMTGEWEFKLHQIEKKNLTRNEFMKGIENMATKIVNSAKNFEEKDTKTHEITLKSPTDGLNMLETFRSYKSQDEKIVIYKTIGNRKIDANELKELIENGIIGPLDGFKSKLGKPFSAFLKLDENYKVKFQFGTQNASNTDGEVKHHVDLNDAVVIGLCPKSARGICPCKDGKLVETTSAYLCQNTGNADHPKCGFRISRIMLSHIIKPEELRDLAEKGKTELIEDFVSKRTKKKFSAYLVLNDNGEIGFEFKKKAPKE